MRMLQKKYIGIVLLLLVAVSASARNAIISVRETVFLRIAYMWMQK